MQEPRFGKLTDGLFYLLVMLVAATIGLFAFEQYPALKVFATFAWALYCIFYVYPWFYPLQRGPVFNVEGRYVDIPKTTTVFYMKNGGNVVVVSVVPAIGRAPIRLSVFDKHMHAWGKSCDGVRDTFVQTMAGDLNVHKIEGGFRLSWTENENWEMGS